VKKRFAITLIFLLCTTFFLACSHKPPTKQTINPLTPGINLEIKTVLTSGKPALIVLGTGLCANCKIVAAIVEKLKVTRKDLGIEWLVYENYRDQVTFKAFGLTVSPTTYLMNQENVVVRKLIGTYSEQDLLDALKEEGLIH
jgi:thiol-disulfide isomerase/thioredoxin